MSDFKQRPATKEWYENWDAVFGGKKRETVAHFEIPVIIRTDRIMKTAYGPVAFLMPGESLIEFGEAVLKE